MYLWQAPLSLQKERKKEKKRDKKKKDVICLKEHIWGVICCILTPDGRFRLTTKPTLAWSDGISLCHFFPPLSTHRKQNTFLHSQPAVLVSVPLGCFIASLLFIDKAGFPWQPLKQVPCVAHTFSKVCFVEAEVWCLKVTAACHDRRGVSWVEQWLEVTVVVCSAWGPLIQHSCWRGCGSTSGHLHLRWR